MYYSGELSRLESLHAYKQTLGAIFNTCNVLNNRYIYNIFNYQLNQYTKVKYGKKLFFYTVTFRTKSKIPWTESTLLCP